MTATGNPQSFKNNEISGNTVDNTPVNAFPGTHNWGYDGVDWFAVSEAYGGPPAYQRFVDTCHAAGLGAFAWR